MSRHPRKDESEARFAQLERAKEERKRKREAEGKTHGGPRFRKAYTQSSIRGAAFVALAPDERSTPTDRQIIAELRRIAMGNVAPSMARFDSCRPVTWPTAAQLCALTGMTWAELIAEAGLICRQ